MKIWKASILIAVVFSVVEMDAKPKEKTEGPTVELPTFVVIGTRIPSSWLEVSYECEGPVPILPIKRAWISKVGSGTPAERAGLKTGDLLLSFDGRTTASMTGVSLHDTLREERSSGTRLDLIVQTKGAEKRTVTIVFK